jgi:SAM-dependent methyltransferase
LCGSDDVDELGARDRDGHPLRTTICRRCGLVWSNPRPSEDEVRRYYSAEYRIHYKGRATPSLRHIARSGRGALNRYRDLAPFLKPGARVLDAGAGGGEVVYVLRKMGVDAMGLEPDEQYAAHARETLGVPVDTGFVQDGSFPPGRFDVITMYHALEHVEDPIGILTTLRGWLSDGGLLLIEVPNVEARCIHPRRRFHFAHFYNFNQVTLESAGRRAGFEPVHTATSPDGGNLISVFRAAGAPAAALPPAADNYTRVSAIVRGHTAAGYYLSAIPYAGPLERLRAFFKDRGATRGRSTAREILNGLIEHT